MGDGDTFEVSVSELSIVHIVIARMVDAGTSIVILTGLPDHEQAWHFCDVTPHGSGSTIECCCSSSNLNKSNDSH